MKHPDVLIVGGGVIGLTAAWYLAGEGATVTVVDQGAVGRQASWAGAGILPPASLGYAQSDLDRLRAHSIRLHENLSVQLREATGLDNGYVVCGGVEVAEPGQGESLPTEEWRGDGVAFEPLDASGLRRRAPDLAPTFAEGAHIPGMAQIRNPWHLRALVEGCVQRGVSLFQGSEANRLRVRARRVEGVECPTSTITAGQYLLTAGAWSAKLLASLAVNLPVHPVRGQMALFRTNTPGVRPILLQGKRYLVPRTDGRVLAGSTEEHAGFDATPTDEGIAGLVEFARALMPSLASAELEKSWAGLRPSNPDGLPYLGRVPNYENLFVGAGHFRAGLQLSPASGLFLSQMLLNQSTLVPTEAFRLDRPNLTRGRAAE